MYTKSDELFWTVLNCPRRKKNVSLQDMMISYDKHVMVSQIIEKGYTLKVAVV